MFQDSFSGKNWELFEFDDRRSLMISQRYQINDLISKIISIRGISDENIPFFLQPSIKNQIPEPFILKDMEKSVERIFLAISKQEKIGIIADYDVDGSTSAALLIKFFNFIGINVHLEIPNRIDEGYGPNFRIIKNFKKKNINLIFCLDCGTSAFDVLNDDILDDIDVIIVDHHVSENKFPSVYSIINPNRYDEDSELRNLAAVGVLFIFLIALRRKLREKNYYKKVNMNEHNLTSYLDLVALGTVCDVVSLKDLNRAYVNKGLEVIYKRTNKGIASLVDIANIHHQPNVFDLSFLIGPRLNAGSRIGDSSLASKILYSNDIIEIESTARKLNLLNEKRKLIENKIIGEAKDQALLQKNKNIIIVESNNWHVGVLGIVASRLVEEFNRPIIVFSKNNEFSIGSGRSVEGIDLGSLVISAKQEGILIKGGGHKMAAGLVISNSKISNFFEYLENNIKKYGSKLYLKPQIFCDLILSVEQINSDFLNNLELLSPFGNGNPEPKFILQNLTINYIKVIKDKHLLLSLKNIYGYSIGGICYNSVDTILGNHLLNSVHKKINIVGNIKRNKYKNDNLAQIIIKDVGYAN